MLTKILRAIKIRQVTKADAYAFVLFLLGLIVISLTPGNLDTSKVGHDAIQNPWISILGYDENIYVVDSDRARILIINPDGKIVRNIDKFSYIDDMTVDEDGNIYVNDTSWKENSFFVNKDTLYSLNPKSGTLLELYHEDYESATKHQMFGVKIISNDIHFVCADHDGLTHIVLDKTGRELRRNSFVYDDAITFLQDICIEQSATKLYAIDKRGEIICFDEDDNVFSPLCRWDNIEGNQYVELYRMDISENNIIYATEIVNNKLVEIDHGKIKSLYSGKEGTFNVSATQKIGLITDGSFLILNEAGEILISADNIYWPISDKIQENSHKISKLVVILTCIYLALRMIIVIMLMKINTAQLISRAVIISAFILVGVITYQLLGNFEGLLIDNKLEKLEFAARNISEMITADDMNGIKKPSDFRNASFMNLEQVMTRIINYHYDDSMYANIIRYDKNSNTVYDVAFRDNSIGAYYPLLGSEAEEVIEVYESAKTLRSSISTENGNFSYVKTPIFNEENNVIGVVEVGTWTNVIAKQVNAIIRNILIQLAVWLVMILFIFNEIFEFMNLKEKEKKFQRLEGEMSLRMNRLLIFLVFLAYNLPTAFLPVYVANNYLKTGAAMNGFAMSAPISINMALLGGIGLIGYLIVKKFSFTGSMIGGALITMAGDLILAFAPGYYYIILGLVLNGIGVGLQMNLTHLINTQLAASKNDRSIHAIYQSSSLSGIMVGMTIGAILADIVGHAKVFFVTALLWLVIVFIMFFVVKKVRLYGGDDKKRLKGMAPVRFFFSRGIFSFLFLAVFFYVMISSFVYYYVPIYNDQIGYSSNTSCLFIILFSLCGIYLATPVTKFMIIKFGNYSMYISSIMSIAALISFALFREIWVLLIVLFTLGFASSFGTTIRLAMFSELPKTQEYGVGVAVGVYDLVQRIGEAVGPIVFASMLTGNFLTGILIFSGISLFALTIYFIIFIKLI